MIDHFGLTFTPQHLQLAQAEREQPVLADAWRKLGEPVSGIAAPQWSGLRYRFENRAGSAHDALAMIAQGLDNAPAGSSALAALQDAVVLLHAFEMTRDQAGGDAPAFLSAFDARVRRLLVETDTSRYPARVWATALAFVAGVVLEDAAALDTAAAEVQRIVAEDIRPQGFIPAAVSGEDGGGMERQVLAVSALVLIAEAASHIGLDLWSYAVRGVSIATAAMYPIYYFYTASKWKWDPNLSPEQVQGTFRAHGGYLELLYRRTRHKDLLPLLEELRPIYDAPGGGLTTLTHAAQEKPRRRGLFGL